MVTYGSLFSGYGGLDMGVQAALGEGRVAWVSDIEPGPQSILAHHYPEAPNLGDVTAIDWAKVEPVDVLTGGSPCQDLSLAGQRAGMRPGTRSGLWESMAHAIKTIRPRLVVWENVRGALSADAFSLMESREGRVGDRPDGPSLRALGRVLGDLTNLGYDAEWTTVRASDIGAPHRRERIFVVAYPHGSGWEGLDDWASQTPPERHGHTLTCVGDDLGQLLPTPTATYSGNTAENHLSKKPGSVKVTDLRILVEELGLVLLPTPQARDGKGVPGGGLNTASLPREIALLPTPTASEGAKGSYGQDRTGHQEFVINAVQRFGDYAAAIERWEQTLGRPAPEPTTPSKTGKPQLSAPFVEWMMGLPEGHVTNPEIGISRVRQLKALGNGVVPQQAEYAIRLLLGKEV